MPAGAHLAAAVAPPAIKENALTHLLRYYYISQWYADVTFILLLYYIVRKSINQSTGWLLFLNIPLIWIRTSNDVRHIFLFGFPQGQFDGRIVFPPAGYLLKQLNPPGKCILFAFEFSSVSELTLWVTLGQWTVVRRLIKIQRKQVTSE